MRAFLLTRVRSIATRKRIKGSCTYRGPFTCQHSLRGSMERCYQNGSNSGFLRNFSGSPVPSRNAFVSQYYEMEDPNEIRSFLGRKRLSFKETDKHYVVRECPFCHATHGKSDNLFKLYVDKVKGVYICHRCGVSGSWFDFKRKLPGSSSVGITSSGSMLHANAFIQEEIKIIQALDNEKAIAIQRNLIEDDEFENVRNYLTQKRGISMDVLKKYCVGAIQQPFRDQKGEQISLPCITFPWMARQSDLDAMGVLLDDSKKQTTDTGTTGAERTTGTTSSSDDKNLFDVVRLKIRALEDKSKQRLVPKGGSWGLFGWNTIPSIATEIVLTEGEFDAMAVYQATGLPAVSLPNGCQSLPPNVLPLLERFSKIYLWMDNDASGQANVSKFASKLGIPRCFIVRPPPSPSSSSLSEKTKAKTIKDANEALLAGLDLRQIIDAAERIPHNQITTFEELRREVYEEILNPLRACGIQSRTLPSINRILKGHRMGEVTVLTGPTGCGKTTLLSQLSLDLCGQGVSTLWGSFEIKNTRLIHKMLTQMAGKNLQGDPETFEMAADRFETLPMYFLRFFGSTEVEEVLDAMEYAVYAHDVQHILLDNVQFMMAGQGRGFDKFERQDAALDKFRLFASQKNIHLTLVIHPRKEQEDVDLNLSSVFGTAKATQEADNVLILQRTRGNTKLDIRKNRFDGTLGSIPLHFDPNSNCLVEFHSGPMEENVASIDMEAEMAFAQAQRQKKMARQQELEQQQQQQQWSDHLYAEPLIKGYEQFYHANPNGNNHDEEVIENQNTSGPNGKYRHVVNGSGSGSGSGSNNNGPAEPFSQFTDIITG